MTMGLLESVTCGEKKGTVNQKQWELSGFRDSWCLPFTSATRERRKPWLLQSLSLLLLSQTGPTTFTFWSQHLETKKSEKWGEGGQGKSNAKYEQLVQQAAKYLLPVFTCDIVSNLVVHHNTPNENKNITLQTSGQFTTHLISFWFV